MKFRKIGLIIVILFVLSVPSYFTYTRFLLNRYEMQGNTITFKSSTYVQNEIFSVTDRENLGKTIGIAVEGKRTLSDYIWPFWVMEYKNDKEHNRIFVQGLMDAGSVYNKTSN